MDKRDKRRIKSLLKRLGFTHEKGSNVWNFNKIEVTFTRRRLRNHQSGVTICKIIICGNFGNFGNFGSKSHSGSKYDEVYKILNETDELKYNFREINLKTLGY